MKILAIMRKDLVRELRSLFSLFMMVAAPLLIAGLLYFAFGGLAGGGAPGVTATRVRVADLDRGDAGSGVTLGPSLVTHLQQGSLKDLLVLGTARDEADARLAVDRREADAALVIPPGFSTAALSDGKTQAVVTIYCDPALTLAPSLLRTLVVSFVDGVVGAGIAAEVTSRRLASAGSALDGRAARSIAERFMHDTGAASGREGAVQVHAPAARRNAGGEFSSIMQGVMISMMVFFVFFTGASASQSLVQETEDGTLARLSTTPTAPSVVLAGKSLAIALTITIQVAVLLSVSAVLFAVRWADPPRMLVAFAGMMAAATGFGLFLMSFCTSSRQAGPILGVGLTVTGMLGGLFTNFVPGLPEALKTMSLVTPQGWSSRLWSLALSGAGAREMAVPLLVLLAAGAVFFFLGVMINRRRFA